MFVPDTSSRSPGAWRWLQRSLVALVLSCSAGYVSAQAVATTPLSIGGNVPGNLLLTPSVEFPTIDSVANLGNYDVTRIYTGYFDAGKCYQYVKGATEADSYFKPISLSATRVCGTGLWSGNYLDWAGTQTIDPFRKALTGGYRVRDTITETWLEKARSDNSSSGGYFPNRNISGTGTVSGATPATNWTDFRTRVSRAGNRMYFTRGGNLGSETDALPTATEYTPATNPLNSGTDNAVYWVIVRVKVCDSSVGLEANCQAYNPIAKPEGLIQKYATKIRYSAFGYLNDGNVLRDGAAMRARQKFVGDQRKNPTTGDWENNPNKEWDPVTGIYVQNPDATDALNTTAAVGRTISNSGVMNYLNKFGQMTSANHKTYDPVSELYYTAIRYLKNQGNIPEYTNLATTGDTNTRYNWADGFPVITDWDDPLQYSCQNNAILGIGDVYAHRDKNLPGHNGGRTDEPAVPALVASDNTVNVRTAMDKIVQLEGISINNDSFTGNQNSAYIAALAYDSHTRDMRTDLDDKQTVSTYWVDVRENQVLENRARNQYWLAAKYGGFDVPDDYDPYARTAALPNNWWSSGETLSNGDPRPENFYVASEADKMVESLTRAFAKIIADTVGTSASLASNATRLDTQTRAFQAQFNSGSWRGDLSSYVINTDGTLATSPLWRANSVLASTTWSTRNIRVNATGAATLPAFTYANLSAAQQTAIGSSDVVEYLSGNRAKEESQPGGTLRTRTGLLGDIVNSTPVFVGPPNTQLYASATFTGASSYAAYASPTGTAATRTQVVYVGANDGMLHAFNVTNGAEVFAFVPSAAILNNLKNFSSPDYEHQYYVDGEIAAADIYDTQSNSWKTVLVGTMGRGGPGVFALDVTNPSAPSLLWEKNGTNIPELGKNLGRPVIAQVANGDWRVIFGNGVGSSAGGSRARLIMIRLGSASNGTVKVVDTVSTTANGMSAVLARDSDADGYTDTVYAGDVKGNVWKVTNLAVSSPTVMNLFTAKDPLGFVQPITAAPLVGRNPLTGQVWIFVGTGQYLNENDLTNKQVQTWYGLKDGLTAISGRSALTARTITTETTLAGLTVRLIQAGTTAQVDTSRGWYIDLRSPVNGAEGERMVVQNRFQGASLIGTTRIPEQGDPCAPGGRGFVMAIDPFTGARLGQTFFDVNADEAFDNADMVCDGSGCVPVSGLGFDSSPNNPIFVEDNMLVAQDNGTAVRRRVQGSAVQATRMSWRELFRE